MDFHTSVDSPLTPTTSRLVGSRPRSCQKQLFPNVGKSKTWDDAYKKYNQLIKEGPTSICSCCGGLWYQESVYNICTETLSKWKVPQDVVRAVLNKGVMKEGKLHHCLCKTCYRTAAKRKIPRLALVNGLEFPPVPPELQGLTQLEERLISPRLPFMQIRLAGFEQQWKNKGNVVNVENNLNTCVTHLPRKFNELTVVQLKLMRRMCYKKPYLYEKIRPAKVIHALKRLLTTPLYQEDNIVMVDNWCDNTNGKKIFKF